MAQIHRHTSARNPQVLATGTEPPQVSGLRWLKFDGKGHVGVGRIGRNSAAAGCMIVACSRGDGAAANDEIAWVTAALQHLRAWGTLPGPG